MARADKPRCALIHPQATFAGKQGFTYLAGVSSETAGATGICLHMLTIPPGGRARAHKHKHHETAIYTVSGEVHTWWGDNLEEHVVSHAGDFLFIPPDVPHLPVNFGPEPAVCLIARTDPNEQESVILMPELESRVPELTDRAAA
jgi:uncharacterized RmlC-like cupin family protein